MPVRDDSLVAQYIRAIENPDSVGYKEGRWYQPSNPNYDSNNRGFGVDVIHNKATNALLNNRQEKWLTEEEERKLRNNHIQESQDALKRNVPWSILRYTPSEQMKAMAVGMLYRGDSVLGNPSVRDAYYSGSDDRMQKAVSDYYKSKKVSERAQRHNQFFNKGKDDLNNVPSSLRKPTPYKPFDFKNEQFVPRKKYDDGGYLNNGWNSLSYADKAEMMKVAVANGITTLPEIRNAYNEFAKGGYKPSSKIQKDIATWEGSEMKRNRPFSEMTQQFNAVVPKELQSRLSPNQLDALYSYGYNVGMGNLKERVLPTLNAYAQGKATNEDVQKSMWATKDSQLRGLAKRRSWERDMFGGAYRAPFSKSSTSKGLGSHIDSTNLGMSPLFYDNLGNSMENIVLPQMGTPLTSVDPETLYKAPTIDNTLFADSTPTVNEPMYDSKQDRLEGIQRFNTIMNLMGQKSPFSMLGDSFQGIMPYVNTIYGS